MGTRPLNIRSILPRSTLVKEKTLNKDNTSFPKIPQILTIIFIMRYISAYGNIVVSEFIQRFGKSIDKHR